MDDDTPDTTAGAPPDLWEVMAVSVDRLTYMVDEPVPLPEGWEPFAVWAQDGRLTVLVRREV